MAEITKDLLIRALSRMGEQAHEEGLKLEICLYGGAAMMLAFDRRTITKDVDALIQPSESGHRIAVRVAPEFGLPEDWFNEDVKQFIAPFEKTRSLPWEAPGIALTAPTASYLLAMKALACRQPLPGYEGDLDDLRFLINKLELRTVDAIQSHIDRYYPDDVITPDHRAVLETLIEEVHDA